MFCKNCGEQIDDKAVVCPKCGVAVNDKLQAAYDDAPSIGFAVLCFFFPLIGLILYLVWKDNYPQKAKSCGKGAIVGVIAEVVLVVIYVIVAVVAVAAVASRYALVALAL